MTAEPTGHVMWSPDPIRQRSANFSLEDVLNLHDDAPLVRRAARRVGTHYRAVPASGPAGPPTPRHTPDERE